MERFRRAMDKSMAYTQSHPEEARKAILTYTKIKAPRGREDEAAHVDDRA